MLGSFFLKEKGSKRTSNSQPTPYCGKGLCPATKESCFENPYKQAPAKKNTGQALPRVNAGKRAFLRRQSRAVIAESGNSFYLTNVN